MDYKESDRGQKQKGIKSCNNELRLVLLGHSWLEKSLTGNTILGQQMFDTSRDVKMCVRRQAFDPSGRRIIIINTPERWVKYNVQDPGLINDNMAECFAMCQPGPHTFLMVVPLGLNKGREWTVEGPLELLNDSVWENTIVIFTRTEQLKGMSMEDYVSKVNFLGPLLKKCGHRYHLLDTSFYGEEEQVKELLEKIDAMVTNKSNTGKVGISNEVVSFLTVHKRGELQEKVNLRQKNVKEARGLLRSIAGNRDPTSMHHILVVGPKQTGKSATCNTILGNEELNTIYGTKLHRQVNIDQKKVIAVDTPGYHGRYYCQDTPEEILQEITTQKTAIPSAVLLVLRSDETFTETDWMKVEKHLCMIGNLVWARTIVLFTYGDKLGSTTIEEHIERWPALQWLLDKCGNRYHVFDNLNKSDHNQVRELMEKIEDLDVLNDGQYLLKCLMNVQESCKKLEEKCKKVEIEMMGESEKLRQIISEKDSLAKDLNLELAMEKMNNLRLGDAEQESSQLRESIAEKDTLIAWLSVEKEAVIQAADQSIEEEKRAFNQKLTEQEQAFKKIYQEKCKKLDQMETRITKLKEENQTLRSENECTKMMLKAAVVEIQKHFEKKYNRKLPMDIMVLENLMRQEDPTTLENDTCKHTTEESNLQPCRVDKEERTYLSQSESSSCQWLMAGGAVLGAALGAGAGCMKMDGWIRLTLSSAAGALLGGLLVQRAKH